MAEQHTLTVLISGSGSNLRALIRACASNHLPNTSIVRVIYNRKAAENGVGIAAAKEAGIPATYHNLLAFEKEDEKEYRKAHGIGVDEGLGEAQKREMKSKARERYDRASASLILEDMPTLVVLAGYMHVVSPCFLDPLKEAGIPIINIHPALPGTYVGAGAILRQYDDFQNGKIDKAGIMVHEVIQEVDVGQPICVREIPIYKDDSLLDFENRVHRNEWELIVEGTHEALKRLHEQRQKQQSS